MKKIFLAPVRFSVDHPKTTIFIILALTVFFLAQAPKLKIDTDPENMLPGDDSVRVLNRAMRDEQPANLVPLRESSAKTFARARSPSRGRVLFSSLP